MNFLLKDKLKNENGKISLFLNLHENTTGLIYTLAVAHNIKNLESCSKYLFN